MGRLPFVSDEDLMAAVEELVGAIRRGRAKAESDPYRNGIDPFSALMDAAFQNITPHEWIEQEKSRQAQKSLQNAIGAFHQSMLGAIPGWRDTGRGGSFDVENPSRGILAEIKNKYNTMNSTNLKGVYDTLASHLDGEKVGYTAYLVQIIPKAPEPYNAVFAPHATTKPRDDIRRTDGRSFYALATGDTHALRKIYEAMPASLAEILPIEARTLTSTPEFAEFFEQIYGEFLR